MIRLPRAPRANSIKRTLSLGFALLVLLLVAAGLFGWATISGMSHEVRDRFAHANDLTRQSSTFSHTITEEVQAATSYLATPDPEFESRYRRLGWDAHRMHRNFTTRRNELAGELTSTAAVDAKLAQVEAVLEVVAGNLGLQRCEVHPVVLGGFCLG